MKKLFFLFISLMIISCSSNEGVYWCGDHPCINKKEKEAYFKKTMIIEKKSSEDVNYMDISEIEKILQEAQSKEKKRIKGEKDFTKQAKFEKKRKIKEEKKLAKQMKLEEKRLIKEEKELAKQIKLEEKKRIKDTKKSSRKKINVNNNKSTEITKSKIRLGEFSEMIEKITRRNNLRPYPDINDIPN